MSTELHTSSGLQNSSSLYPKHPFADIRSVHGPIALDLLGGPRDRYDLIYADPCWSYENWSEKGEDRNAKAWYDCMGVDELKALPVGDLASDNSMLACWATYPCLLHALEVIRHWGFTYVTIGWVWVKLNKKVGLRRIVDLLSDIFMSTGYWTRANSEIIILAKRGQPQRDSKSIREVVFEPRAKHSEKPLVFRKYLEDLILAERRIELFCRHDATPQWDVWGNQIGAHEAGTITKRKLELPPLPLLEAA